MQKYWQVNKQEYQFKQWWL